MLRLTILLLAFLGWRSPAQADPPYESGNRGRYIHRLLEALRATDRRTLDDTRNYIHVIDRNKCKSEFADLKTNCLLEAASRNCNQKRGGKKARQRCRLVSDVIITNKLGEKEFIDTRTKIAIMKGHSDYRREISKELWRRYAALVTEFSLSAHHRTSDGNLASHIDRYCMACADQRGLSWQYCVAAVVWFIGTSQEEAGK